MFNAFISQLQEFIDMSSCGRHVFNVCYASVQYSSDTIYIHGHLHTHKFWAISLEPTSEWKRWMKTENSSSGRSASPQMFLCSPAEGAMARQWQLLLLLFEIKASIGTKVSCENQVIGSFKLKKALDWVTMGLCSIIHNPDSVRNALH